MYKRRNLYKALAPDTPIPDTPIQESFIITGTFTTTSANQSVRLLGGSYSGMSETIVYVDGEEVTLSSGNYTVPGIGDHTVRYEVSPQVTSMAYMFRDCSNLTSLDLSNFNGDNITSLYYSFYNCSKLVSLNVANLNTSNVTTLYYSFYNCSSLTSLDISNWDTSNVTKMQSMFSYCSSLTSLDLSNWDTSNVTKMYGMFSYCSKLTSLDLSNWDTSKVTDMGSMFYNCNKLTTLDVSNWSKVTHTPDMFSGCSSLTALDVSNWDTSSLDTMQGMFNYCSKLTSLDLSNWDTSKVTSMAYAFSSCSSLTALDVSNWDTSKVTDMGNMFYNCSKLTSLDLSNWDTSNVTNMISMFYNCSLLTSLIMESNGKTSPLNQSLVTNAELFDQITTNGIFYCDDETLYSKIIEVLPLTWSVGILETPRSFITCKFETSIDNQSIKIFNVDPNSEKLVDLIVDGVSNYPVSSNYITFTTAGEHTVVFRYRGISDNGSISGLFEGCDQLISCNLRKFQLMSNYSNLFKNCSRLTSVYMDGDISQNDVASNVVDMFAGITTKGILHYDDYSYDYSKIINILPPTWKSLASNQIQVVNGIITTTSANSSPILSGSDLAKGSQPIIKVYVDDELVELYDGPVNPGHILTPIATAGKHTIRYEIPMYIEDFYDLFSCSVLTSLDVSNFDTSNATNMARMFENCSALTSLDVSNFDTSKVTSMSYMFDDCSSLTSLDVSNFDTSKVTNMSNMFGYCDNLTSLDVSNWDTSNVIYLGNMFYRCFSLTSLDVSNWDTSNAIGMAEMFCECEKITSLDVSNWDTSNVTNMNRMFDDCSSLTSLDVSNWDTSNVTSMESMFWSCPLLTSLDVSNWDTSNVIYLGNMFYGCSSLTSLDVSNWDTSNVVDMQRMFYGCSSLTSLDVSNWDTSNVVDMNYNSYGGTYGIFQNCSSLTLLDLSNWNTSKVTSMGSMFYNCKKLTSLDLSNFDTSNVTNMQRMFDGCNELISVNLSNSDTRNVTDAKEMFYGCTKLISVLMGYPLNASCTVTSMFNNVTTNGTFYYNGEYNYDNIFGVLPSTWKSVNLLNYDTCTSLELIAEDVIYSADQVKANYVAYVNGKIAFTNKPFYDFRLSGQELYSIEPNNTGADIEKTVRYTFLDKTATDTFIHYGKYRNVNLNNSWVSSGISNPDSSIFDIYESSSNYNVDNGTSCMYITISGLKSFEFYIRSNAETDLDYVMVSNLDETIDGNTLPTSSSVKVHTSGNQQAGTNLSDYTQVKFDKLDEKKHVITILYKKNASGNVGDDKGYLLLPKDMEYSSGPAKISFTWHHNKSGYILGTGEYEAEEGMTWEQWAASPYFDKVAEYVQTDLSSYKSHYYYVYGGHPGIRVNASSWYVFYLKDQKPTDVIQDGKAYTSSIY